MENQNQEELIFEVETTPASEYIACAFYALSAVDGMDPMVMGPKRGKMVNEINKKSLEIIHYYINLCHEETFAEPDDISGN